MLAVQTKLWGLSDLYHFDINFEKQQHADFRQINSLVKINGTLSVFKFCGERGHMHQYLPAVYSMAQSRPRLVLGISC